MLIYQNMPQVLHPSKGEKLDNVWVNASKFRNRLAHIYWEIDDTRVYQILKDHLCDFKNLIDSIARFLKWDL